jgi:hypothetical protein
MPRGNRRLIAIGITITLLCALSSRALAVGWGPTDFLITGASNFPDRIGIFDHDFTFKGYLDQNFLGVQGMDFDAHGNLVAVSSLSTNPEVRVYSPSGTRIGGFFTNNPGLQFTGDLKVAPNGDYAFGSNTTGVQVYTPNGSLVTQYGSGNSQAITYLPGNRLWAGGTGTTVHIFDTTGGAEVGTFTATGQTRSTSMQYSAQTNSVLITDSFLGVGGLYERDLAGASVNQFFAPSNASFYTATRGPDGDVFATFGKANVGLSDYYDVVEWHSDGTFVTRFLSYPIDTAAVRIVWAGNAPEPSSALTTLGVSLATFLRRRRSHT